jgi:hypothetical protein
MLWSAYTIAFWGLLRSDEVLRIRMEHLEFVSLTEVALYLLWRKTNQTGGRRRDPDRFVMPDEFSRHKAIPLPSIA